MSPWGSPDHTQKIELEYMRYKEVYEPSVGYQAMPAVLTPLVIIDRDLIGNFGRIRIASKAPGVFLRVTIDGYYFFNYSAEELLTLGYYGINSGFDKYGVTRYDDEASRYNFFYDEHWGIWIKDHLKVDVIQTIGVASEVAWRVFYKERDETR